ncbi:MAG: rhamnogalacturonan lyase [Sphingomonas sp.]
MQGFRKLLIATSALGGLLAVANAVGAAPPREAERLDRGLIASPARGGGWLVSWRLLDSDAPNARFDVYRDGRRINSQPIARTTSFVDPAGSATALYTVRGVGASATRKAGAPAIMMPNGYLSIPLAPPAGGKEPDGESYTYTANDVSVGDLDGDGRYELILKWDPSNSHDNSQAGYTGDVFVDAYGLDGRRLWRIDLGKNIRAGAHYTQFQIFDFDGDGRAEVAMKTAEGTVDGTGKIIGDARADWRSHDGEVPQPDRTGAKLLADGTRVAPLKGRILKGPEYLTVFDGRTGRALATALYDPPRYPGGNPTFEQLRDTWGDGYANRADRFLAGTAYLDGRHPSMIFGRGYYARTAIAAWDYRGGKLTRRWLFDSAAPGNGDYGNRGNHQLSIADVDGDGRDEVIYGSMAVDDNGKGLWTDPLYHGDTMHVGDLDPLRPGLEKWGVFEEVKANGGLGSGLLDARTGEVLWTKPAETDTGRGVAADIDPRHVGDEFWGSNSRDLFDVHGTAIGTAPRQTNFAIYWDGDFLRELLDGTTISKWDWNSSTAIALLHPDDVASNNGTKAAPALQADILGDWREEVVWRSADNRELRIYATPYPTTHRLVTLMQDPVYRAGVAWQNTAYNQPPHLSYFPGALKPSETAAQ